MKLVTGNAPVMSHGIACFGSSWLFYGKSETSQVQVLAAQFIFLRRYVPIVAELFMFGFMISSGS